MTANQLRIMNIIKKRIDILQDGFFEFLPVVFIISEGAVKTKMSMINGQWTASGADLGAIGVYRTYSLFMDGKAVVELSIPRLIQESRRVGVSINVIVEAVVIHELVHALQEVMRLGNFRDDQLAVLFKQAINVDDDLAEQDELEAHHISDSIILGDYAAAVQTPTIQKFISHARGERFINNEFEKWFRERLRKTRTLEFLNRTINQFQSWL